jgi:hypothetical protein
LYYPVTVAGGLTGGTSVVVYPAMAPSGTINGINWFPIGHQDDGAGFGAVLTGWFNAFTARNYVFATKSDDGSRLYVDGNLVVDNGNDHSANETILNTWYLMPGLHKLTVNFYENGAGPSAVTAFLDPGLIPTDAPTPVPIPNTLFLFAPVLLGLAGLRRRFSN